MVIQPAASEIIIPLDVINRIWLVIIFPVFFRKEMVHQKNRALTPAAVKRKHSSHLLQRDSHAFLKKRLLIHFMKNHAAGDN